MAGDFQTGGDMATNRLLRRKEASNYLREVHGIERAVATLAGDAVTGGGPVFRRIGRIPLYAECDLDEWVASKLSPRMHSTSQAVPEGADGQNAQPISDAPTNQQLGRGRQ